MAEVWSMAPTEAAQRIDRLARRQDSRLRLMGPVEGFEEEGCWPYLWVLVESPEVAR
jgi:hypothetical protein